jgi:sarcosine oxidase
MTTPPPYDVAVLGLGAMGAAAAWSLTRQGLRVIGFDRFAPPHDLGSTHGRTRIIREAYFEHPLYVPLVRRAFEGWEALGKHAGRPLLRSTGGIVIGPPEGTLLAGSRASVLEHDIAHEALTADEIQHRFPGFAPPEGAGGILEHRAGVLFPETCVEALLAAAAAGGAELRTGQPVEAWRSEGDGVRLELADGVEVRADKVVLAAGAWMPELLGEAALPLAIERQLSCWYTPVAGAPDFGRVPVAIWEYAPGRHFYTFPDLGDGVKIGIHHEGTGADPRSIDRVPGREELERVRALLARHLPGAAGELREAGVCMYTNTPDGHFVIDRHPGCARAIIVSACSGHGFKFAVAIGDIVADLVLGREPAFDIAPFRFARPALG